MQATKNILNELYQRIYELEDLIITIPHKLIDYKDNSHEQSIKELLLKIFIQENEIAKQITSLTWTTFPIDQTLCSINFSTFSLLDNNRINRTKIYKTLRKTNKNQWNTVTIINNGVECSIEEAIIHMLAYSRELSLNIIDNINEINKILFA